ncbi:UTP--glucose-1-phosphate uridylyltransferase GalU [Alkalicoccus luteus]|uniref:UTP--glucose-1-phosphate uridylyltransferase n=1 Tax=Alkalicoccus luteus TaxID=1237094 RepID=A0A969Q083_9BACI|nr:UTP--glucose-1-phosphate uridylyltransferase GalU [Alkalicoccus luteus]
MKVKKAIIPAAGLGTRFLPATKAMPKEMLPIIDKPTIQYIVEEAVASGIEDIIIVTGKGKRAIEDHFDHAFELEESLWKKEKHELLEKVRVSSTLVDIHYIRQKEPKGLGHAVWCARKFIGDEPFAVLLGDDIVHSKKPCLKQLMDEFETHQAPILGVQKVPRNETGRYGIVDAASVHGRLYKAYSLVEKPNPADAPSDLAVLGRYILTPDIFERLEHAEPGAGGEIQLTDAIRDIAIEKMVYAYDFEGIRYDVGEKLGFIQTTISYAMRDAALKEALIPFLQKEIRQALQEEPT